MRKVLTFVLVVLGFQMNAQRAITGNVFSGNEPLIISNAKGSCGCTVPQWPKDPIKPGDSGEIKVVYNSKNKGAVGGKAETKTVTITANTNPVETRVFIKGTVDKVEGPEEAPSN